MSILEVDHVSIRYMTGDFKEIGLKEYTMRRLKGNYHVQEFWADKDVTFSLEKGDMLGIIGVNGAGKSTLLKAISGIMEPSKGYVKREGNIAALLELASGFDGELTVRENTYLRGAMLGYTRRFMDEKYEEIIDFAELQEFQDRPFRQLSSGMKSRLAFSIASLVQPDLLILDEVLSVGDGAFQQKSAEKMREIIQGGATTILVSHSIEQVESLCNKVLWLHKGEQIAFGDTEELCSLYRRFLDGEIEIENVQLLQPKQTILEQQTEERMEERPSKSQETQLRQNPPKTPEEWVRFICLFLFSFILIVGHMIDISPVSISGDAASIWESIKGIADGTPVASYVLYKGMMSCYPYVWLYQLSQWLELPSFFFVKLYHGILFAYITAVGVPYVIEHFFQRRPKMWQVLLFSFVSFTLWKPTYALDQLMVDLPCCAFFLLAIHIGIRLEETHKGYIATVFFAGILCGLNTTASGQYSLAMLCVLFFDLMQIIIKRNGNFPKKRRFCYVFVLLTGFAIPYCLNAVFVAKVVEPLIKGGVWIPDGDYWMRRGLLYLLPNMENYPFRYNMRGYAILESIYGSAEAAEAALTAASYAAASYTAGVGWTVQEWFTAFARYPLDFLILILDKAFMCVTTDARNGDLHHLIIGYTLLYIALFQILRYTPTIRGIFQRKTLLVMAGLLTILPLVVLSVEVRCAISLQGLMFGAALMGPALTEGGRAVVGTVLQLVRGKTRLKDIPNCGFPWGVLLGICFVWVCLTHYGDLMAHTYTGLELLFTK